ncbi:hypothetical protein QC761_203395 [Podospora bellae-mahoneyi]|uniref:Uncharacterized protein n=1 Tax=Podospora bellae-mahoneyi TaxID=2093777 RepID=A0ABR0FNU9_9PEZI|nr:hypothetical protein QC761_203395 [Podospora bellae-mahoneyi]
MALCLCLLFNPSWCPRSLPPKRHPWLRLWMPLHLPAASTAVAVHLPMAIGARLLRAPTARLQPRLRLQLLSRMMANGGSNDKQGSDGNDESNNTGGQSTASWSIVQNLFQGLLDGFLTPRLYMFQRHCLCFLRPFSYTGLEGLVHFWKRGYFFSRPHHG